MGRSADSKPKDEDNLKQILKALEGLNPSEKGNNRPVFMERSVPNNFSRQPRMQN